MSTAAAPASAEQPAVDEIIRRTVRALRSAHNADALDIARHIGISRAALYNRLNGAAPFLAAEIAGLAHFFGVPIADFYDGVVRIHATRSSGGTEVRTRGYLGRSSALARVIPLFSGPPDGYLPVASGYGSSGQGRGTYGGNVAYSGGPAVASSSGVVKNAHTA